MGVPTRLMYIQYIILTTVYYTRKTLQKNIIICIYYNLQQVYVYKWREINQTFGAYRECALNKLIKLYSAYKNIIFLRPRTKKYHAIYTLYVCVCVGYIVGIPTQISDFDSNIYIFIYIICTLCGRSLYTKLTN